MPIFDGPNLTITLDSGVTEVDVGGNLYSEWKEWMLLSDNSKYPPAFRTIGGDPLTPGIEAGAYFFIRNDLGWRIKPPEEDITIYIVGNIAPEDSALPIVIPTIGTFTATIIGLQPITQKVDKVLSQIQETTYQGAVWMDESSGVSGTSFPIGTASSPVDNFQDAMAIANIYGLKKLFLLGTITLDRTLNGWTIEGSAGHATINLNGQNLNNTVIKRADITGNVSLPGQFDRLVLEQCFISPTGITGFKGIMLDTTFFGNIQLVGNTSIIRCRSALTTTQHVVVDVSGISNSNINFNEMEGAYNISNMTQATTLMTFSLSRGHLMIDNTNTAGTLFLQGEAFLQNMSAGLTVDEHEFQNLYEKSYTVQDMWDKDVTQLNTNNSIGKLVKEINVNVKNAFAVAASKA